MELNELLDNLIKEIKCDQRYIDYLEAEKKLYIPENKSLLKTYQSKLDEYEELKKYEQYIDNTDIKEEIKKLKKVNESKDLEDLARERLNMVKPDETVYIDIGKRGN